MHRFRGAGGARAVSAAPAGSWTARQGRLARCLKGVCALLLSLLLAPALAHESEQYTLPAGRDFADLGPELSRGFMRAIREAVHDTNAAIDQALTGGALPAQVQELQSASHIADEVWGRLFNLYPTNELLDMGLAAPATTARYPGLVTMYRPIESIYDDTLLMMDPSKPVRAFFRAGTVSAGGVLFGTDKIIHFINVGRIYHVRYLAAVAAGLDEAGASWQAVQTTADNPMLSEDGLLGLLTTGIRSNGDLAADYAGLKFYRNLTETVAFGATTRPPMLRRDGPYWRIAIDDEDSVFTVFVSPHWNEVLNPNTYLAYVGRRVRSVIGTRCDDVFDWYRGADGQPLDRAWFGARQQELSTWFGEAYGHELEAHGAVSVTELCWPKQHAAARPPSTPLWWGAALPSDRPDVLDRSALWWAAAAGDELQVEALLARGLPPDQPDRDGETPLHAAVRQGRVQIVQLLLDRGANVNHASSQGVAPLLLATTTGQAPLAEQLLQAGADPNAADRFGRTALHEAALRDDLALARLLLHHGADATLASRHGTDALTIANRGGSRELVAALRTSAPAVRKLGPPDGESVGLTARQDP